MVATDSYITVLINELMDEFGFKDFSSGYTAEGM